jgi:hypothetical protein
MPPLALVADCGNASAAPVQLSAPALIAVTTDPNVWLGMAIMATVPAYLALQFWLAYAWAGRWRMAALVPLIFVLPALAFSLYATVRGSNLAPLPFILASPLALLYLLTAWVVRKATRSAAV